jgi:hypothetical protein
MKARKGHGQVAPRLETLMAGLPRGRARAALTARDVSPELRAEIVDYFRIFRWLDKTGEKFSLHHYIVEDVLLLNTLILLKFEPTSRSVCSPARIAALIARYSPDLRVKTTRSLSILDAETFASIVDDFWYIGSTRIVAKRFTLSRDAVMSAVLHRSMDTLDEKENEIIRQKTERRLH